MSAVFTTRCVRMGTVEPAEPFAPAAPNAGDGTAAGAPTAVSAFARRTADCGEGIDADVCEAPPHAAPINPASVRNPRTPSRTRLRIRSSFATVDASTARQEPGVPEGSKVVLRRALPRARIHRLARRTSCFTRFGPTFDP